MAKKKIENWRGALSFSSDRNCFPHRNRWGQATPLRVNVSSQKKWKEETRAIFLEKKKAMECPSSLPGGIVYLGSRDGPLPARFFTL